MAAPGRESIVLTFLNTVLSVVASILGSVKDFPLGLIAGLTWEFIIIGILGAVLGTILALRQVRWWWILAIVLVVIMVPALFAYSYLLSRGGLSLGQIILAGFLFLYIFFVVSFLFTYLEMLITRQFGHTA